MFKFLRIAGNATWALAFGLSVWLAMKHHGYKVDIALGAAILALVLSAVGLLLARYSYRHGDKTAAAIGVTVWLVGALAFSVTEFGYWASSYKERHATYVKLKQANARQETLTDRDWKALQTGEMRAGAAELEARKKASQQSDLWLLTKQCGSARTAEARGFCGEYFKLEERIATAVKMEALEAKFLSEKQTVDENQDLANKVFAIADLIDESTDRLDEREAATLVIFLVALLLMVARDLLPIAVNPFRKRQEALTLPAGAEPATLAAVIASVAPRGNVGASEVIPGAGKNLDHVRDATKMVACADEPTGPLIGSFSTLENVPYASDEEIANLRRVIADMKAAGIEPKALTEEAKALTSSEIGSNSPNLDSEESDGTVPFVPAADDIDTEAARKVVSLFRDDMPKPMVAEHPFSADVKIKREKTTRGTGSAVHWAEELTEMDEDDNIETTIVDIWPSYVAWCRINNFHAMPKKELSRKLGAHLKIPPGRKNGKRTGSGKVFRGLIVHMPAEQETRRYA